MQSPDVSDWNDLRYLLAVARGGSTAAAARALHVNQSTVVRRIAALEEDLGLRLFDKKRDGYRLTAEGAALVEHAGTVEEAILAFTRQAATLDDTVNGSLRVTLPEGLALEFIAPLLNDFHRAHPGLHVSLLIENRHRDLGDGEVDVALRAGTPQDGKLIGRKLAKLAWAVYGSRGYVEKQGRPYALEDLNGHQLVAFGGELANIAVARWLNGVAPRAQVVGHCDTILCLLYSLQSGLGLALLPCHIGDSKPDLVRVIDPVPALEAPLWLLTHPDLRKTPKVRAFFDFITVEIERYRSILAGETRPSGVDPEKAAASALP